MSELRSRTPRPYEEILPDRWTTAINTNPLALFISERQRRVPFDAAARAYLRQNDGSSSIERIAAGRSTAEEEYPESGVIASLPPSVQEHLRSIGLLANFVTRDHGLLARFIAAGLKPLEKTGQTPPPDRNPLSRYAGQ